LEFSPFNAELAPPLPLFADAWAPVKLSEAPRPIDVKPPLPNSSIASPIRDTDPVRMLGAAPVMWSTASPGEFTALEVPCTVIEPLLTSTLAVTHVLKRYEYWLKMSSDPLPMSSVPVLVSVPPSVRLLAPSPE
jgi:hypothetical protein